MTAVGDKFSKEFIATSEGIQKYASAASWANLNGKVIVDVGDAYEIQEPPEPTEEEKATRIRAKRDALLAATDYLLMPDYPIEADKLAEIKKYRQALRDIPYQEGFPDTVTFPEKPEGI